MQGWMRGLTPDYFRREREREEGIDESVRGSRERDVPDSPFANLSPRDT
jgi:hypothetical protein